MAQLYKPTKKQNKLKKSKIRLKKNLYKRQTMGLTH